MTVVGGIALVKGLAGLAALGAGLIRMARVMRHGMRGFRKGFEAPPRGDGDR